MNINKLKNCICYVLNQKELYKFKNYKKIVLILFI